MLQTISFNHANFPVSVHLLGVQDNNRMNRNIYNELRMNMHWRIWGGGAKGRSPLGSIFFIFMHFFGIFC